MLPSVPTFATAHELTTQPNRIDWLIDGVIPRGGFGLLFGDPGAGKSFLALAWSCAVATGLDWLGRAVRRGTVVYVAGEGFGGIGRRIAAWSAHNVADTEDAALYVSRYATNFLDAEDMALTVEDLKRAPQPVVLFVVDTMARATPGMNEDRANEVGEFVEACDNLRATFEGAAILVLHHSPHSDKSRAKGSIALKGAVDFEAGLMNTSENGVVRLTCTKMKDGEPFGDMHLRFQSVELSDGATSAVLVECDPPSARNGPGRKVKLSANDKLFLAALGIEPVDEAKVRAAFLERHPNPNRESAAKTYLRVRKRGARLSWFVEDGKTLIPSAADIMRDRTDSTDKPDTE